MSVNCAEKYILKTGGPLGWPFPSQIFWGWGGCWDLWCFQVLSERKDQNGPEAVKRWNVLFAVCAEESGRLSNCCQRHRPTRVNSWEEYFNLGIPNFHPTNGSFILRTDAAVQLWLWDEGKTAEIIPDHPAAGLAVHIVHGGIPSGVGTFPLPDKRPEIKAHFYPPRICPVSISSERKHIAPKLPP